MRNSEPTRFPLYQKLVDPEYSVLVDHHDHDLTTNKTTH